MLATRANLFTYFCHGWNVYGYTVLLQFGFANQTRDGASLYQCTTLVSLFFVLWTLTSTSPFERIRLLREASTGFDSNSVWYGSLPLLCTWIDTVRLFLPIQGYNQNEERARTTQLGHGTSRYTCTSWLSVNPDPHRFWSDGSGSGFMGAKWPKKYEKIFLVFEVLDVLFRKLEVSPVVWRINIMQFCFFKNRVWFLK